MSAENVSFKTAWIAQQMPAKIAAVDYFNKNAGLRERTFAELESGVRAVHALFEFYGIGQGSYIAVLAQNRSEVLEVFLAAFRVGAIPYAVNPNLTDHAKRNMFEELPPDFVFLEAEELESVQALVDISLQTQFILFGESAQHKVDKAEGVLCQAYDVLRESAWNIPSLRFESTPQFVVFTSGSTGVPKAILRDFTPPASLPLEVAGIKVYENEESFLATPQVGATPLFHSVGDTLKILQAGISVTMLRSFDANIYLELVSKYQPAFLWLLPSHLALCNRLKHKWQGRFSRLKLVAVGGAACSDKQMQAARELFQCPVVSFYGLTEGGPQFSFADLDLNTLPSNCVGRCQPDAEVKLLDPAGNEADEGELCFRNQSLFKGYFGNEELTSKKLQNGWLHTGDIFKRDEGGLFYYQGRIDDMFVCGGENIYPLEVEKLLLAHPEIEAACVAPCEDDVSGLVPMAMVVLKPQASAVGRKELQEYCVQQGAGVGYPRWISVVETLPTTGPGKVDRKKVSALLSEAYQDWINTKGIDEPSFKRELDTELTHKITGLICELCDLEAVKVEDNVFRIGMSSFHVTVFCSRIKEHFGVRISMEDVFRLEYVESIVAKIQQDLDVKKVLDADPTLNKDTGITL